MQEKRKTARLSVVVSASQKWPMTQKPTSMLYVSSPFTVLLKTSDNLQFDIDIYAETKEKAPVKDLVRSKLVPQLREAFQTLGPALIKEHGKDIQHQADSNPSSGFSTPTWHPAKERQPTKTGSSNTQTTGTSSVNTTTVTANDEFRTTAEEMFQTFTDPQRLAAFTRAPPKVFEGAKAGAKFAIFDGNVSGEFVTLEKPTKIVQKWRLAQWPEGHTSNQEIVFDQNEIDHVTNMRVTWTGVPVGQEEVVQTELGGILREKYQADFWVSERSLTDSGRLANSMQLWYHTLSPCCKITIAILCEMLCFHCYRYIRQK